MTENFLLQKLTQLKSHDSIQINKEGDPAENYEDFQQGEDFLEGRDVNHARVYKNQTMNSIDGTTEVLAITLTIVVI